MSHQITIFDTKIKDAAIASAILSIFFLTGIGIEIVRELYQKRTLEDRLKNVIHVATVRSDIKNRLGADELREAEEIVGDSTLTIETMLSWPNNPSQPKQYETDN